ncbi:MAG: AlpA family transcriptional regulator [Lysobacterales bacterium]
MHASTQRANKAAVSQPKLLRLPQVEELTGFKRSQLYRLQAAGKFPKRVKISQRSSAWVASEVDAWIRARIAESRA